jgi:hypothetical protein
MFKHTMKRSTDLDGLPRRAEQLEMSGCPDGKHESTCLPSGKCWGCPFPSRPSSCWFVHTGHWTHLILIKEAHQVQ